MDEPNAMASFTKRVLTPGPAAAPCPKQGQRVEVAADLYLATGPAARGQPVWSTHKPFGFLFSAEDGPVGSVGEGATVSPARHLCPPPLSAVPRPQPFAYRSGTGGVIKGWDDGVATMKLGERAELYIPYARPTHRTAQPAPLPASCRPHGAATGGRD